MASMYSEEIAKTKWCPFVRHGDEEGGTFNRGAGPGNAINAGRAGDGWSCACIASGCMAWRKAFQDGRGYCGLAGRVDA